MKWWLLALAGLVLPRLALAAEQPDRQIAITIDDLPIAHSGPGACQPARLRDLTGQLLGHFAGTNATAFVIANNCAGLSAAEREAALRRWVDAGAELGNHTYSHPGLGRVTSEEYHADILRAEPLLKAVAGKSARYFRSPMLHVGPTLEKKVALEQFLRDHGYQQAPVTIDNSDWLISNALTKALASGDTALQERIRREYIAYMERVIGFFERRSVEIVGREFPQILLIHANVLNAQMGGELLAMLRRRGYRFVTLATALRDPAYQLPDGYIGPNGISWIHRWALGQGRPVVWEPDVPEWLSAAAQR